MSLYLDTSVLVSCYISEPQSHAVLNQIAAYPIELLVSQLAELEFYSALSMKQRCKHISLTQKQAVLDFFQQHLEAGHYTKIYVTDESYQLAKHFLMNSLIQLRTLDALHLALAKAVDAELFTADKELAKAAKQLKVKYRIA